MPLVQAGGQRRRHADGLIEGVAARGCTLASTGAKLTDVRPNEKLFRTNVHKYFTWSSRLDLVERVVFERKPD